MTCERQSKKPGSRKNVFDYDTLPKQNATFGCIFSWFLSSKLLVLLVSPPLMAPPCIWTFTKMKEFKSKLGKEKNSRLVVKRGEVVTIRVPTHPEGKRVCWEFATDDYDIGFGVYFDWTPVTSTDITVQVSDSSEDEDEDEEEEEEIEGKFNFNIICNLLLLAQPSF